MSGQDSAAQLDPLLAEALAWVRRIQTGEIDAGADRAFAAWRASGPQAERALREAQDISELARFAAKELLAERRAEWAVAAEPEPQPSAARGPPVSRRMLVGSALAASVAGAAVIVTGGGLIEEPADFATRKGERRTLALAPGLNLVLDAQTRANVATTPRGYRVELLGGRAEVDAALASAGEVVLVAGRGAVATRRAKFEARLDGQAGCVTCLDGMAAFAHGGRRLTLAAGQQLTYDEQRVESPVAVDPAVVSSWRNGTLIFHRTPLEEVVREVNRYRSGRIVIASSAVGRHQVSGVFYIDRMDRAVSQIEQITGTSAVSLPAGLVVLT